MKLKMMQDNGTMVLVVSGTNQDLIIREECGYFTIEVLEKCEKDAQPIANDVDAQKVIRLVTEKEAESLVAEKEEVHLIAGKEEDAPEAAPNDELFKKLALLRKSLAATENVPPYLVFHDKTLHEMVSKMPKDLKTMGGISGVGLAKLEKYGHVFLDAINNAG